MMGLSDCHIHMVLDGHDWRQAIASHRDAPREDRIRQVLAQYQHHGYTYLRDGGDRWGVGKLARDLAPEYGITYRTPLSPLCHAGHYGGFIGEKYGDLKDFLELVKKMQAQGADFIKVMISGLMDFDHFGVLTEDGLAADEIGQLIHIAHEEGFSVMAHANGARTAQIAAAAGVDSIEHGAYLDLDTLQTMAQMGTVWVPTLSAIANLRGTGRFCEEAVGQILASAEENLRQFAALGGLIACGSDAGAWAVPHGCNTELPLLRSALGKNADEIICRGNQTIMKKF